MFQDIETILPVNEFDIVNRLHPLNRGKRLWMITLPHLASGKTWYDLVGTSIGTLNGFTGLGWGNSGRQGAFGDLFFDGASYVDCTANDSSLNFTTGNFSVIFSAKFTSIATNPVPINRGTFATNGWYVFISSTGVLELQCESSGVDNAISTASGMVVAGLWHQYALVRTGPTTGAIYKDGLPVSTTGSLGNCASSTSPLQIGQYSGGADRVGGYMDDVGIWDRALSATEVAEYYSISRKNYPGLFNRWPLRVMNGPSVRFITPTGIPSVEAWGNATFVPGVANISPYGIVSSERWGSPSFLHAVSLITPYGIPSSEAWGMAHIALAHRAGVILPTSVVLGNNGQVSLQLGNNGKSTVILQ